VATQERAAAIVGIHEWPKRLDPGVSALQIKAQSIGRALEDAGLSWKDVDGLYDAGEGEGGGGLGLAPYLGIKPKVTTPPGGCTSSRRPRDATSRRGRRG
jgi:acetyl-CoA C-acetyltransferase